MIGVHPITRKLLCDLNCNVCGGWKKQGCIMVGGTVNMYFAFLRCISEGITIDKVGLPIEFWADNMELSQKTCPAADYVIYENEVIN